MKGEEKGVGEGGKNKQTNKKKKKEATEGDLFGGEKNGERRNCTRLKQRQGLREKNPALLGELARVQQQ